MACCFCEVDSQRTKIVEKGKRVFVCLSNPRLMVGHLLVIPKRHIERISELDEQEMKEVFDMLLKYQGLILERIASGCDIRRNYRPFMKENGVKVNHLHFHLLPREPKDELYQKSMIHEKEIFKDLTPGEIETILTKLK